MLDPEPGEEHVEVAQWLTEIRPVEPDQGNACAGKVQDSFHSCKHSLSFLTMDFMVNWFQDYFKEIALAVDNE